MTTQDAVVYERSILSNIMLEVRRKFCEATIEAATVETLDQDGMFKFSLPCVPELPGGFQWSGRSDTIYGARAYGWEAALKRLYQAHTSANTSVNATRSPAIARLVEKHVGWVSGTTNLDYGCGRYPEHLTQYLKERGVRNLPFDPFNLGSEENSSTLEVMQTVDVATVTLSNVLCVLSGEALRGAVIRSCHQYLMSGGRLFVTVYEGDGTGRGRETKPDCWQENRRTSSYIPEIEEIFGVGTVRRYGKLLVAEKE